MFDWIARWAVTSVHSCAVRIALSISLSLSLSPLYPTPPSSILGRQREHTVVALQSIPLFPSSRRRRREREDPRTERILHATNRVQSVAGRGLVHNSARSYWFFSPPLVQKAFKKGAVLDTPSPFWGKETKRKTLN